MIPGQKMPSKKEQKKCDEVYMNISIEKKDSWECS